MKKNYDSIETKVEMIKDQVEEIKNDYREDLKELRHENREDHRAVAAKMDAIVLNLSKFKKTIYALLGVGVLLALHDGSFAWKLLEKLVL